MGVRVSLGLLRPWQKWLCSGLWFRERKRSMRVRIPSVALTPVRLAVQDTALSRQRQHFEYATGEKNKRKENTYETVINKGYLKTGTSDIPQCGYGVIVAHNLAKVVVRVQIPLFTLDGTSHSDTNVGILRGGRWQSRGVQRGAIPRTEPVRIRRCSVAKLHKSCPCGVMD